jgi:hypothetical protein
VQSVAGSSDGNSVFFSAREATDGSSDFDIFKLDVANRNAFILTNNTTDDLDVSVSANAAEIAFQGEVSGKKVVYYYLFADTGLSIKALSTPSQQWQPSISSNGHFIALVRQLASGKRVMLFDTGLESYFPIVSSTSFIAHPSVTDSGEMIAWLEGAGAQVVKIKNRSTGITSVVLDSPSEIEHPHLTRHGDFLAYGVVDTYGPGTDDLNLFMKNLLDGTVVAGTKQSGSHDISAMYWQTPAVNCGKPVVIPDAGLEAQIRFELEKSTGDIHCSDMETLKDTSFHLSTRQIYE